MKRNDNALRSAADRGTKSTVLGIGVNLGLGLAKCYAAFLGNSFALVADGVESITDVLSGFVVYFELKIARKPADADHPYGHGKAEPIAAVVVSLTLMVAAFGIIYEGIREITTPHPALAPYTLVVLAGVLIIKELLFRQVQFVGDSIGSLAVKRATPGTIEVMHVCICFRWHFHRNTWRAGVGSGRWMGNPMPPLW